MFNKRYLIVGILLFWLLAIGLFVSSKEVVLTNGQTVLIPVEPIDPRDMFRGDYVNLNYNISSFDKSLYFDSRSSGNPNPLRKGDVLYVLAEMLDGKVVDVVYYSENFEGINKVAEYYKDGTVEGNNQEMVLLKAVVERDSLSLGKVFVKYGIESFFVPEGIGREIERCGRTKCTSNLDEPFTGLDLDAGPMMSMYGKAKVDKEGNLVLEALILSNGEEIR